MLPMVTLSCTNNQQHHPISNINSSMLNENRKQYNTVAHNRTRMLTTLSPSATNTKEACWYEPISYSVPGINKYGGNSCLLHHRYQGWQNRRHN